MMGSRAVHFGPPSRIRDRQVGSNALEIKADLTKRLMGRALNELWFGNNCFDA
jgi:hypothetical protein